MSKRLQTVAESQYGLPQPLSVQNPNPIIAKRAPNSADTGFPLGQTWIDKVGNTSYTLTSVAAGSANWVSTGGAGAVNTINGQLPVAGNFDMVGTANQITVTPAPGQDTISLPSTVVVGTSVTSGSFITSNVAIGSTFTDNTLTVTGTNANSDLVLNGKGIGGVTSARSLAGSPVRISVQNLDNTMAGSNASFRATVPAGGGGDPFSQYSITGTKDWSIGLDRTTNDFTISESTALGTNNALRILNTTRDVLVVSGSLAVQAGSVGTINGSLILGTAGNKVNIATGVNASVGTAVLVAGTVVVPTTAISASSLVFVTYVTTINPGALSVDPVNYIPGVSFVINSDTPADASTVNWWIIN